MSLKESPSVLSLAISGARLYLREFNIFITGNIKRGEWVEIKAQHKARGAVTVFITVEAATAEYILRSVVEAYITQIYITKEEMSRRELA